VEVGVSSTNLALMGGSWGVSGYPAPWRQMFLLELWSTQRRGRLSAHLVSGEIDEFIGEYAYELLAAPAPQLFVLNASAEVPATGVYHLELRRDGALLGRKPLAFGALPRDPASRPELVDVEMGKVQALLAASKDPRLPASLRAGVEYFCVAQSVQHTGDTMSVEQALVAAYWENYPLVLPVTIGLQTRLPAGKRYAVEFETASVFTGARTPFLRGEVESASDSTAIQVVQETLLQVDGPGMYFVSVRINGARLASRMLVAETSEAKWSFSLMPEDELQVRQGELLLLGQGAVSRPSELKLAD
jgi:hypothetical protein